MVIKKRVKKMISWYQKYFAADVSNPTATALVKTGQYTVVMSR